MIHLFLAVPLATADTCASLNRTFVPDHGWAEVWRRGPHGGRGLEGKIDRTKARVPSDPKLYRRAAGLLDSTSQLPRMLPYGCWFYFNTKGSGVFLKVGRSLRARTRKEMTEALGLPCLSSFNRHPGWREEDCYIPGDFVWCALARMRGYDSLQVAWSHQEGAPELVLCTGRCASAPLNGSCPPRDVVLRDAHGQECACVDGADTHTINCGQDHRPVHPCLSEVRARRFRE